MYLEKSLEGEVDHLKVEQNYKDAIDLVNKVVSVFSLNKVSMLEVLNVSYASQLIKQGKYERAIEILKSCSTSQAAKIQWEKIIRESPRSLEWKIGDTGPAGGIIIYDVDADNVKGNKDELDSALQNWRFIESTKNLITIDAWEGSGKVILYTSAVVGSGIQNTNAIIQALGDMQSAARTCTTYVQNDYSDWFLPSLKEARQLLTILTSNRTIKADTAIWSSTAHLMLGSWIAVCFDNALREKTCPRSKRNSIYAVRYF